MKFLLVVSMSALLGVAQGQSLECDNVKLAGVQEVVTIEKLEHGPIVTGQLELIGRVTKIGLALVGTSKNDSFELFDQYCKKYLFETYTHQQPPVNCNPHSRAPCIPVKKLMGKLSSEDLENEYFHCKPI